MSQINFDDVQNDMGGGPWTLMCHVGVVNLLTELSEDKTEPDSPRVESCS